MLKRKTDNFNDFSRYYSEENQELLEKKSKFMPYLTLFLLLFFIFFSYFIYSYNKEDENRQASITPSTKENTPSLSTIDTKKSIPISSQHNNKQKSSLEKRKLTMQEKEKIKELVIKKVIEKKILKEQSEKRKIQKVSSKKVIKKESSKKIAMAKVNKQLKPKIKNSERKAIIIEDIQPIPYYSDEILEKKKLDTLSIELEKILNKE